MHQIMFGSAPKINVRAAARPGVCHWVGLVLWAGCALGNAQLQRLPNATLAMPAAPPVQGYTLTNAFGALNFFDPVCIASPPGETNRLFVVEHFGNIAVITNLAAPNRTVFLSISNKVTYADEGGLLGLVFHPGFASNGLFYVWYYGPDTTSAGSGPHDILAQIASVAAQREFCVSHDRGEVDPAV